GTDVNSGTDTITINGHGFSDGQAVTYHAPAAKTFRSGSVDVQVSGGNLQTDSNGNIIDYPGNDNIYLAAHGFATGDQVRYNKTGSGAAIGGLTPGQDYYVIAVGANELKLASARTVFDGNTNVNATADTIQVSGLAAGTRVVYSAGGGTSIGLAEGGIY